MGAPTRVVSLVPPTYQNVVSEVNSPPPSQIHSQHYLALVVQNLKPGAVGEVGAVVVGEHELHLLLVLLRVQWRRRRQGVRSRMVRPRRQRRRRLLGDSDSHGA